MLRQTENAYIETNKDKIRVMHHSPRININSFHLNNNNVQSWPPWFKLNIKNQLHSNLHIHIIINAW